MGDFSFKISEHGEEEIMQSLTLVRLSFGNVDIASRAYYNWQYLQNPVGRANVIVAYFNDKPAGQFAFISCRYKIMAEEIIVPLTLNLCVSPKFRGRGLMGQLISNMHEFLDDKASFSIGVPNEASIVGHLRNGYVALPLPLLVRPIRPSLYFSNMIIRSSMNPLDLFWKKNSTDTRGNYKRCFI